jgi:hypothetical protein
MALASHPFRELAFEIWQVPGISRAWKYEFADGSYVLVTDIGGYDLPDAGGPYVGLYLSNGDELIEHEPLLRNAKNLVRWFEHARRLTKYRAQPTDGSRGVFG